MIKRDNPRDRTAGFGIHSDHAYVMASLRQEERILACLTRDQNLCLMDRKKACSQHRRIAAATRTDLLVPKDPSV